MQGGVDGGIGEWRRGEGEGKGELLDEHLLTAHVNKFNVNDPRKIVRRPGVVLLNVDLLVLFK